MDAVALKPFWFLWLQSMLKFAQTERVRPLPDKRVSPEARSRKKQRMQNNENNEKKVEIVVKCKEPEKEEEVRPEKQGVKLLFEKFDLLKKADEDFNSFLEVVSKDIAAKSDRLKKVKVRGASILRWYNDDMMMIWWRYDDDMM